MAHEVAVIPLPSKPDVIVVGAGAAGLSAAKHLMAAGRDVLVLEAADYVGGRCVTDSFTFPVPFDRGGSWLHSAEKNPLARIAEKQGTTLHKTPWQHAWVRTPERFLTNAEVADYGQFHAAMWEAINAAGSDFPTASVESVLPVSPWRDTAKHWVAQMLGGDADETSASDSAQYADADGDWLVEGGLGAFVHSLHANVPVRLNCPVRGIDYSGAGVRIVTPDGDVETKCAVLTVSVGVLAAEAIRFTPGLPDDKLSAIQHLPMGLLNKVGILFDPKWTGAHEGQMIDYAPGGDAFCTILLGFYGSSLASGFTAGRFGGLLEAEGPGAATAFCLQALREVFGSDVTKHVRQTSETAWRGDPHKLGSYSHAMPGGHGARAALATPLQDKVFFAGEATMPDAFATVHGAYRSGLAAAKQVIERDRSLANG